MIVPVDEIISFLDIDDDVYLNSVSGLHLGLEQYISNSCNRVFESTDYFLERYDGNGNSNLYLRNYPIINLTLLAIGTLDLVNITNVNNNTMASVSANDSSIILTRDNATDLTLKFTDFPTITDIVNGINAYGNGWSANCQNGALGVWQSKMILKKFGANCNNKYMISLQVPNYAENFFEVFESRGIVTLQRGCMAGDDGYTHGYPVGYAPDYRPGWSTPYARQAIFPRGNRNVFVSYTAGYDSDSMPDQLKLGVKISISHFWDKMQDSSWNLEHFKEGDIAGTIGKNGLDIPREAKNLINPFKSHLV